MRRMIAAGPPAKRPPHSGLAPESAGGSVAGSARLLSRLATAAVVLLVMGSAALGSDDEKLRIGEFIPVTPPQPAPEVAFSNSDGKAASLADFAGKPAVVNLWATWCEPCLKEMPSLERLQSKFAGRLVVAAVSEDHGGGKVVTPFVAEHEIKGLRIYLDPKGDVGHAFKARGLPTSIVLDAKGRVVGKVEGPAEWDSAKMTEVLEPLLDKGEGALKKAAR